MQLFHEKMVRLAATAMGVSVIGVFGFSGTAGAAPHTAVPPLVSLSPVVQVGVCGVGVGAFGVGSTSRCAGVQQTQSRGGARPLVSVAPTVQANGCGTGIGIGGIGTTSSCATHQSAPAQQGGSLIAVNPTAQVNLCGVGAGIDGVGTTASCSPAHTAPRAVETGSAATLDPSVQVDVCGIGVGIAGTGTTSRCNTDQGHGTGQSGSVDVAVCGVGVGVSGTGSSGACSSNPTNTHTGQHPAVPRGGGSSTNAPTRGPSLFDTLTRPAFLTRTGTLPFTGANGAIPATVASLILLAVGGFLTRTKTTTIG